MNRKIEILREFLHNSNIGEVIIRVGRQQHDDLLSSGPVREILEHVHIEFGLWRDLLVLVCHLQSLDQDFDFLENFRARIEAQDDVAEALGGFMAVSRGFLQLVVGEEAGIARIKFCLSCSRAYLHLEVLRKQSLRCEDQ